MTDVPEFFVPAATPESAESIYADFAKSCRVPVPPLAERIYSITFRHNGEVWTATVGEQMQGVRYTTRRIRGEPIERSQTLSDPALVLAIFPGNPYHVFTNHGIVGNVGSRWANPFYAGQPDTATRFRSA